MYCKYLSKNTTLFYVLVFKKTNLCLHAIYPQRYGNYVHGFGKHTLRSETPRSL